MAWRIWIIWRIIFCITYSRLLWICLKNHGVKTDNPSIRIYVNKIENIITFRIKTGYYLELLTHETMKSFGSTESEITKDKNASHFSSNEKTIFSFIDIISLHNFSSSLNRIYLFSIFVLLIFSWNPVCIAFSFDTFCDSSEICSKLDDNWQ